VNAVTFETRDVARRAAGSDRMPASFALAVLMHLLLFGGMTLAVQWRTQPAGPVVAELWGALPPPQVEPPPAPAPAPRPDPAPRPPPEPPPPREPDIALKQERKAAPKAETRPRELKPEPRKAVAEPRKPEPRKAEAKSAPAEEPPRPRTDLDRLMAQAQAAAAPPGAATTAAAGGRAADAEYQALLNACIRPHIVFVVPEATSPAVHAVFRVELLPDGAVAAVRLQRASGLSGYDAAAERAIRRCDPFPRKRDGSLDRAVYVTMRPVEAAMTLRPVEPR